MDYAEPNVDSCGDEGAHEDRNGRRETHGIRVGESK